MAAAPGIQPWRPSQIGRATLWHSIIARSKPVVSKRIPSVPPFPMTFARPQGQRRRGHPGAARDRRCAPVRRPRVHRADHAVRRRSGWRRSPRSWSYRRTEGSFGPGSVRRGRPGQRCRQKRITPAPRPVSWSLPRWSMGSRRGRTGRHRETPATGQNLRRIAMDTPSLCRSETEPAGTRTTRRGPRCGGCRHESNGLSCRDPLCDIGPSATRLVFGLRGEGRFVRDRILILWHTPIGGRSASISCATRYCPGTGLTMAASVLSQFVRCRPNAAADATRLRPRRPDSPAMMSGAPAEPFRRNADRAVPDGRRIESRCQDDPALPTA